MIVVADASPMVVLVKIAMIDVLERLYGKIIIPDAVFAELQSSRRALQIRQYFATHPPWIEVRRPAVSLSISGLDAGRVRSIEADGFLDFSQASR
jgi:predicted nucleic acid-binding protein